MSLVFDGTDIPGLHGPLVFGSPENVRRPVKFFQVRGEGEIAGEVAGRSIMVRVLLNDDYDTQAKLDAKIKELNELVGTNSTLEEEGNLERDLDYCTFEGWEPIPLQGQEDPGPLPDIAGSLGTANCWFIQIVLRFRQLRWK